MTARLYPYFKRAYHGKRVWNRIKKKYQFNECTQLVIMPEDDEGLNDIAFHYMPYMMKRRGADKAIVVRRKEKAGESLISHEAYETQYCYLEPNAIYDLIHYYELYIFTRNISIISCTRPNGNTMHKFLGKNGVNEEDLVCLCMYFLRSMPKEGELQ